MSRQLRLSFQDDSEASPVSRQYDRPPTAQGGAVRETIAAVRPQVVEQLFPVNGHAKSENESANGHDRVNGEQSSLPLASRGEKAKARDILAAIRILNEIRQKDREVSEEERLRLKRFGGFGPVALRIFPDPTTGQYKDDDWRSMGEELTKLLSPSEYESAKRTTFNAFYTSPVVTKAMFEALERLGVPQNALILEPGCGAGNFMAAASSEMRFVGVEQDSTSGRLARALYPQQDIRIEGFQKTRLPNESFDAVIGNVPFANLKLTHKGQKYSLHDYFIVKSIDALKPGGVMAVVTSRFTLDKRNGATREYVSERADFVGAIRLPAEAFQREGTSVVTDIVMLRKRDADQKPNHVDASWMETTELSVEGTTVCVNRYFAEHPEVVLGDWTLQKQLYGDDGYSIRSNGNLADQLANSIDQLPKADTSRTSVFQQEATAPRFARPPPLNHITEGSFFVGDNGLVCQQVNGESQPVKHGDIPINARRGKTGRRLAALIGLRDAARRVLQSQNENWPESERESVRRELNFKYDYFSSQYGPINKTTFSQTRKGTNIRRMPNLVKFRNDPDAMLVMSLEEYDETTTKAAKAPILLQDVVGRKAPVTTVASAEEGLLVSLDRHGKVDVPYIARLYEKSESEVVSELGDLIYRNPVADTWETADVYLSGNVRVKLAEAEQAGPEFSTNAEALKLVQPPDVLPGDIDANLGSPWIPVDVVQGFSADAFGVEPSSVRIGHVAKDATWSVEADYSTERSVAVTSHYGTKRIQGTTLLEQALNMKTPVIYDTIDDDGRERRVVNQDETLAAKEKQKLLKEAFRSWVFDDSVRAERLVRIYNDTYNNLRLREFDGSHLEFPGMNHVMQLRAHQKNAIWRCMSSGNTLLAHAVGAGKTFVMAATGMKLKEAGIVQKPMYVVPNHMLEQFAREFMQLYPNAHLLMATKEDMARDRRKFLTARIASGSWDGVIVTHSSFERIGMSAAYQQRFLREQIEDYERLLVEVAASDESRPHRNLIKTIEKQKANREARLEELAAETKKDDGLVFDELGVDHIFIDEAHYFKNLETQTKMQRVAGIQTGGSQRAFDLFMKTRFLDEQQANRGVTFSTATPISNTMVEMYTVQRFLDPHGLAARGVEHFDAWAATFGEVVEAMEISPDGASLRQRSRFARFNNLPELQQMFRSFTDVQTAAKLDLPSPRLKGGKPHIVACPMSEVQRELQQKLVERYDRIRSTRIDPREDNALAITTDGRKLALDARLLSPEAADHPESKVNAIVANIFRIWEATIDRSGTQIVFSDMGVRPTKWGYCVYDEVIAKLAAYGVPTDQIAAVGDATSDAKKQSLFERVRNGSIRVLIGSTQKMGVGTNVQKRLVALHHLDAPWKPAEVEQREGRILRQGNDNKEVAIYRYVTEGSFDAFMWQALETKARFITQVMTGNCGVRRAEDIGGQELSFAEVKAIASGNPAVLTLAEADAELQRLGVLKKNHTDEQFLIRRKLRELPETVAQLGKRIRDIQLDETTINAHQSDGISFDGRSSHPDDLVKALDSRIQRTPAHVSSRTQRLIGEFRGLAFGIVLYPYSRPEVYLQGKCSRTRTLSNDNAGPRAVLNALTRLADGYGEQIEKLIRDRSLAEQQLQDYAGSSDKPFEHGNYMQQLRETRDKLKQALAGYLPEDATESLATEELANRIQQLLSQASVEPKHAETERRPNAQFSPSSEEPITARIRRRLGNALAESDDSPAKKKSEPLVVDITPDATAPTVRQHNASVVVSAETQLELF
ncbi:hypothetical protein KOR42_34200 [Thalassoglobus neptunius]|uniref:Helicase ATP-binding domain-containing protein n=1 Tax=Thalassoglobus neptunius TaxID=1938619 RepID=A0A5C5WNY4_9PLAN|nr:DEAD/DEAH box helicase family protein [Thalassoglobus neptunius]TWT51733.1 hypothetical protein KOR42_34200 [Thalassoglobus neptunius]